MNYRQWKKNYKKKHGVNPPITIDKRKKKKFIKKWFKNNDKQIALLQKEILYILERTARVLSFAFDNVSKTLNKLAESMKNEVAENENR